MEGRAPYLDSIASGNVIYEGIKLEVDDVRRLCNDALLLVGRTQMQTIQLGVAKALHNIFMMVWVKGEDGATAHGFLAIYSGPGVGGESIRIPGRD